MTKEEKTLISVKEDAQHIGIFEKARIKAKEQGRSLSNYILRLVYDDLNKDNDQDR